VEIQRDDSKLEGSSRASIRDFFLWLLKREIVLGGEEILICFLFEFFIIFFKTQ
jgi:hypothetical protein